MNMSNRILIIEDNETSALLIQTIIEENIEYQVDIVNNGKEALSYFDENNPPRLVLLDVMLPDIDGFSILNKIRANPQTKNLPVIIVSAKDRTEDFILAKKNGANEYITKPIEIEDFYRVILKYL